MMNMKTLMLGICGKYFKKSKVKKHCKLSPSGSFCKYFTDSIFSLPSETSTV